MPNPRSIGARALHLLLPGRFESAANAYGYTRALFESVAAGDMPGVFSITPSTRHVGVTRKDTFRPGFDAAVRAANSEGYPVLVRSAGGGATVADVGTFGFSIVRPTAGLEGDRSGIRERYDEAAGLMLAAFGRLGVRAEVGEVWDEFCPGDHSIRVGDYGSGTKVVGIAQRITKKVTSVGGIVLVYGERDLAVVLEKVYAAMSLPFRAGSVGSLRHAGYEDGVDEVIEAFAAEAEYRYGAVRVPVDRALLQRARDGTGESRIVR